jgi:hypothetical protein
MALEVCPDGVCFKNGQNAHFFSAAPDLSPPSHQFLLVFDTKTLIHEDPTVQYLIHLRKRVP